MFDRLDEAHLQSRRSYLREVASSEEGRPLIKENTHQLSTHSTQSEARVSQGFDRNANKLSATDFYSNNLALYSVDMKTGFLTAIATMGYGLSSGLELAPATK